MKNFLGKLFTQKIPAELKEEEVLEVTMIYLKDTELRLFYAWLVGYREETIYSETDNFLGRLFSEPDNVNHSSELLAFNYLSRNLNKIFSINPWNQFTRNYYSSSLSEKDLIIIDAIVEKWPRDGLKVTQEPYYENYRDIVLDYVYALRSRDINAIFDKVLEKWEFLEKILENSILESINEYGDQSLVKFDDECEKFGKYYFSDENLNFFDESTSQPLVTMYVTSFATRLLDCTPNAELPMSPVKQLDLHSWCAKQFTSHGWEVIDFNGLESTFVVMRVGFKLAVVCISQSKLVDTSVVQKISDIKTEISADNACVITDGRFTSSVIKQSITNNVSLLLHTDRLDNFFRRIK